MASQFGPLLKWAGGKRQLLPHLRRFYPPAFNRYVEPFFGSGAVFFDLHGSGRLRGHEAILIDSNPDLIGCYEAVRDCCDGVMRALEELAEAHAAGGGAHYYKIRDQCFNPLREELRQPDGRIAYTPALAAMLIYLNRTGYNGLFRVNSRGGFNVPAGRYSKPSIANRDRLVRVAEALSQPGVRLVLGSFEATRGIAAPEDFIYSDPPYAPLSKSASFTSYTASRFDEADQARLQKLLLDMARRGCYVLLSNSTAPGISALYETNREAADAGLATFRVPARRAINSNASRRGSVDEYLITNIPASEGVA
jgi:DNA adenine methylase